MMTRMTEKTMGMSTMSRRIAGPLVAVLLAAGAVTGTGAAQAAGPVSGASGWHDGACAANEGQTVVVDHRDDPKSQKPIIPDNWKAKPGILVRCNVGGTWANSDGDGRTEPLKAVGITYAPKDGVGLIDTVNGVKDNEDLGKYWMYSMASKPGGKWNMMVPKPGKNTWVGVTLGGKEVPSIDPPVKK